MRSASGDRLRAIALAVLSVACGSARGDAPPSGEILFAAERDGRVAVHAVRPLPGAAPRLVADDPIASLFPAPGPWPLAVAAAGEDPDHREELVLLSPPRRALPGASGRARHPSWSPDGAWLVHESDRDSFRDLVRVDLATGATTRLTRTAHGAFEPSVSPDGRYVAFVSTDDGDSEIYVVGADGGRPTRLTFFHRQDFAPAWSPDGTWIAFVSDREGVERVFLVRPDGTGLRRLTADDARQEDHAWSPDGTRIAYRAGVSGVRVADVHTGVSTLVSSTGEQPAWSPDGRWLVFSSRAAPGEADLHLARPDGTGLARLTSLPGAEWLPRWLPSAP